MIVDRSTSAESDGTSLPDRGRSTSDRLAAVCICAAINKRRRTARRDFHVPTSDEPPDSRGEEGDRRCSCREISAFRPFLINFCPPSVTRRTLPASAARITQYCALLIRVYHSCTRYMDEIPVSKLRAVYHGRPFSFRGGRREEEWGGGRGTREGN